MLTEIYCNAFGEQKKVLFFPGLNVIQGYSDEDDGNGNSIGKTNMLKIIDFTFGGQYYSDSNDDVIRHVGEHDICFTHMFNGKEYRFIRSTAERNQVIRCADNSYAPASEITVKEFCEWLLKQYKTEALQLSFREIVGLYSRIWNKPNKEVNRPLYNYRAQSVSDAIISLVKLFGKYGPIQELHEQDKYLKKRQAVLKDAVSYHLLKIPSKQEYEKTKEQLSEIQETLRTLRANIAIGSNENIDQLDEQNARLYEQRSLLQTQQGRTKRTLQRCRKNMANLDPPSEDVFLPLREFFPNVDISRIKEIQGFHNQLRLVLMEELKIEEAELQQNLDKINSALKKNEQCIQELTELPTQAATAMEQIIQLAAKQEQLQNQLDLYEDKGKDAAQKAENSKTLTQTLGATTAEIQEQINEKILEYSEKIATSNSRAPMLYLSAKDYHYGVEDNTGTGKAYTDLLLFDLAVLSLTQLPILIHDSFLFNNIDDLTKQSFIRLYNNFPDKQIFISLDQFYGKDNEEIDKILFNSTRLTLTGRSMLYGKDWRKPKAKA